MSDEPQGSPPVRQTEDGATTVPPEMGAAGENGFCPTMEILPPRNPSKGGRPTLYTLQLGEFICDHIENGGTLYSLCKGEDMPDRKTVARWRQTYPDFARNLHVARQIAADGMADEVVGIADEGGEKAPLQVRTRMWLLGCYFPQTFGAKVGLGIGSPPTAYEEVPAIEARAPAADQNGGAHVLGGTVVAMRRQINGSSGT